jgi:hypothetical protein
MEVTVILDVFKYGLPVGFDFFCIHFAYVAWLDLGKNPEACFSN